MKRGNDEVRRYGNNMEKRKPNPLKKFATIASIYLLFVSKITRNYEREIYELDSQSFKHTFFYLDNYEKNGRHGK